MGSGIGAKSPDFSEVSRGPVQPGEARGALASGDLWALSGQPWSGLTQRLIPWGGMGTIRSEETSWMLSLLKN